MGLGRTNWLAVNKDRCCPNHGGPPSFILVLTILSYFNRKVPKAIGNMRTASRSVQWQDIAILTPFTLLMVVVLMCVRAPASANRPTDRTCSPTRLTPSRTSTMCTSWTCRQWRGHSASPYPRGWARRYLRLLTTVRSILWSGVYLAGSPVCWVFCVHVLLCSGPSNSTINVPLFFSVYSPIRPAMFLL